jgi:hypothetical protein
VPKFAGDPQSGFDLFSLGLTGLGAGGPTPVIRFFDLMLWFGHDTQGHGESGKGTRIGPIFDPDAANKTTGDARR